MKEKNFLIILPILIVISIITSYFVLTSSQFNFDKSAINIPGNKITETIWFHPDTDYHTLYRNFETPISYESGEGGWGLGGGGGVGGGGGR